MKMATALAVAVLVYACAGKKDGGKRLDLAETPFQTVDSMFVIQSKNGVLKMRVEAGVMERYQNDSLSYDRFPSGVAVYGYTETGALESRILADQALHEQYKDGREMWKAFGNVVVSNIIKQETMETDTLYWDQKNEKIYTDCYVRMYSPAGFMQGFGMESDQNATNAIILKPFNSYGVVVQDTTRVEVDSINFIGPLLKN